MLPEDAAQRPTDDFNQLKLLFTDPLQHDYELIRPIVLFAELVATRSAQTGMDRTTVGEKARRFMEQGMLGLRDQRASHSGRKPHTFPEPIATYILYLKQLYPPIHDREIVRIVERKYGYKTNHHTVKRFLARYEIPVQLPLAWTVFHDFEDAYRARWTVVRMYYEGWHAQSIAGCLNLSERHVRRILEAFEHDGFAGLEDQRSRPPDHPANQLTLPLLKEMLDLQHEYPRAGRFRLHGLLEQQFEEQGRAEQVPSERTLGRAMAINRHFHDAPGPWVSDKKGDAGDNEPKELPYQPLYRHHYWFIDIRYLVQRDGHWVYSICILEGYSRKILAGMASVYQDLIAVLQILAAAIADYGCPLGMVSDNGSVFTSHTYRAILVALDIEWCPIEKGKPWQNLIEAMFKVELRLADHKFEQAQTVEAIQAEHAKFVETYNTTPHWAHQDRADGLRTPVDVLRWLRGRIVAPDTLRQVLRHVQLDRTVDRRGYISVQRFYLYAERGLARKRVAIWLYEGRLHIEYQQTLLARYAYRYDRKHKRLQTIDQPQIHHTAFADPQLELWELDDEQWRKIVEREARQRRRKEASRSSGEQLRLGMAFLLILLVACVKHAR
jgi:transposase InsO family protein